MLKSAMNTIKKFVASPVNVQLFILVLTVVLFTLGAGAPGTSGGLGGFIGRW